MKEFSLLFALFFFITTTSQAQHQNCAIVIKPYQLLDRNLNGSISGTTIINNNAPFKKKPIERGGIVTAVALGTAANVNTVLESATTDVYADGKLNTVLFIHRNDNTIFENNTSHFRYDISKDGGQNWTLNIGPLNPRCKDSLNWYNSRFPQALIFNPDSNNTNADSAYLAYMGAWIDNASAVSSSTWNGIITGVERLDTSLSTRTENDLTLNNGNTLIATSLCKGLPGEFWAIDEEQSGYYNDSMIIVYKGIWDSTIKDVTWSVFTKLNPHFYKDIDTTTWFQPLIAFDPSGMNGWIASLADFGGNLKYSLTPFFYNTIDGGQTWTGPYIANTLAIPSIMNIVSQSSQSAVPICGGDFDLAVDKNGAPHLVTTVGTLSPDNKYNILTDDPILLYDFSYSVDSALWNVAGIYHIDAFSGTIGTYISTNTPFVTRNRPQISMSPDGSRLLYIWEDSPTNPGPDNNIVPDLLGIGYDVDSHKWTSVDTFTNSGIWSGRAYLPSVSPVALRSGSTTTAPVVITQLDPGPSHDPTLPVSFYYFSNISFDDDSYNFQRSAGQFSTTKDIQKSDANINLFPNPADNLVFINAPSSSLLNSTINVYNVLGELIFFDKNRDNSSYTLNTKSFINGVYTISIVNGKSVSSKQFVISH